MSGSRSSSSSFDESKSVPLSLPGTNAVILSSLSNTETLASHSTTCKTLENKNEIEDVRIQQENKRLVQINAAELKKMHETSELDTSSFLASPLAEIILQYCHINAPSLSVQGPADLYTIYAYAYKKRRENSLMDHIVKGRRSSVISILKQLLPIEPKLLLETGEAFDYSGRHIIATPLGAALGAGDVDTQIFSDYMDSLLRSNAMKPSSEQITYDQEDIRGIQRTLSDGMAEVILKYLNEMPDAKKIINEQIKQQFPDGWEEKASIKNQEDIDALHTVFKTIHESKDINDEGTQAIVNAFLTHLENRAKEVVREGMHTNANQLLLEAYKLYRKYFKAFGNNPESPKNKLAWKLLGYIQQFLTACDAQAYCQGLRSIVRDQDPLKDRHLNLLLNRGVFFPLDTNIKERIKWPGAARSDLYQNGCFTEPTSQRVLDDLHPTIMDSIHFEKLYRQKETHLKEYISPPKPEQTPQKSSWCSIM